MSLAFNIRDERFIGGFKRAPTYNRYSTINSVVDPVDGICFVELRRSASYSFSPQMLRELLDCARNAHEIAGAEILVRALVSLRKGVFALGGDLAFFRDCITQGRRSELEHYAATATDLIWESVSGSGIDDLVSFAVVQGEAQGGGFEAALAAHVLIAEKGTCFGFPEGLFGLFPGMGARDLLTARSKRVDAGKMVGSARRYTAEELYSLGVVDVLAEPGKGIDVLRTMVQSQDKARLADLRGRFSSIRKTTLQEAVEEWVELALKLPPKHLRTIEYLILAQERARKKLPSVCVI